MRIIENYLFFYATSEIYSNWHPAKFKYKGHSFSNSEQAMMYDKAMLMGDSLTASKVLKTPNPAEVKKLGRQVNPWKQAIWDNKKFRIIVNICYAKFKANPAMIKELLETGDLILVEASPYDEIWGIKMGEDEPGIENPRNWKGENLLGKALMVVRDMLRKEQRPKLG